MNTCDTELIYSKHGINLLKGICKSEKIVYYVTGNCHTRVYEDYDDALEYYNLQWMKTEYGEQS